MAAAYWYVVIRAYVLPLHENLILIKCYWVVFKDAQMYATINSAKSITVRPLQ